MSESNFQQDQDSKQFRCFPRSHMPSRVGSYYDYAFAVSRKSGIFYSNDREDAKDFDNDGVSKNTITAWRQILEKLGWFERLDRGKRLKRNRQTGMYMPIRYKVLDHVEWTAKHPGKCRVSEDSDLSQLQSQKLGQDVADLSQNTPTTCPKTHVPPVPKVGTKVVKKDCKEKESNISSFSFSERPRISKAEVQALTDYLGSQVLAADPAASGFTDKGRFEIQRAIRTHCPTQEELKTVAFGMVGRSDDSKYTSQRSGEFIANSLGARILELRERRQKAIDNENLAKRMDEKESDNWFGAKVETVAAQSQSEWKEDPTAI